MDVSTAPVYILEPFYGGSHKQLIDFLVPALSEESFHDVQLFTLPAKKWHWRARCSALKLSQMVPPALPGVRRQPVIFCSSVLNLSEFLSLRSDLKPSKTIVYFHENQLVYPVQEGSSKGERDFQYGYNQILTALVADVVVFNSQFNKSSFLDNINSFFNQQPDCKPDTGDIRQQIDAKSSVVHFPVPVPPLAEASPVREEFLHIVWPHRWEHDKDPDTFFKVLFQLKEQGHSFRVSVLGESFTQTPDVFDEAKSKLSAEIVHFGRLESKEEYFSVLRSADVVVSTARHEFFGVAMVEAGLCGCLPLAPNRLSYPEIFPDKCLYRTDQQLFKKLRDFCKKPHIPRRIWDKAEISVKSYDQLKCEYVALFK